MSRGSAVLCTDTVEFFCTRDTKKIVDGFYLGIAGDVFSIPFEDDIRQESHSPNLRNI